MDETPFHGETRRLLSDSLGSHGGIAPQQAEILHKLSPRLSDVNQLLSLWKRRNAFQRTSGESHHGVDESRPIWLKPTSPPEGDGSGQLGGVHLRGPSGHF